MNTSLSDQNIDRIDRFQSLQAGQYWRARQAIKESAIEEGVVLLIESIRWVDDAPHTIVLRPHPSMIGKEVTLEQTLSDGRVSTRRTTIREHRFLLNDFLSQFEFEPDHQRIRSEEVRKVQGRINELQEELVATQSNPALLAEVVATGLEELAKAQAEKDKKEGKEAAPAPVTALTVQADAINGPAAIATGTIANAIGSGITTESIATIRAAAQREHQVATIKSKWIQSKTSEIAETITALTPFYAEQAAAALAQTEDVRTYVAKLMQGIESLDLYVGKDVEVTTIQTGESAPRDVPLTFVQKKLMMDEELAVWADVDEWFDFSKENLFFEALCKHEALVNQIFPTQRCVLVMATTRRYIDYGDTWANMSRNAENSKVFLLIRDGGNLYRVLSSVESHLGTARLFPSKNDQDSIFRGFDGSQIKFEDVSYTDKLAAHEKFALHYKRFLLLACGLDHRLKLFGDFYDGPPSFHFVSMAFQEQNCRFLHDDDGAGLLAGEQRMPLKDWILEKNGYLRSGSRVLCKWSEVMNPDTAPGACRRDSSLGRGFDRKYLPKELMSVAIAYRSGSSICVDTEVSGYSYSIHSERAFNCKVNLTKFHDGHWSYTDQPYLCLDAVRPEDLHWYIHHRDTRADHISYIRFFKNALRHIQQERQDEQDTRRRLLQALADGNVAAPDEREEIIHQTVIAWRAANRGKSLPKFTGDRVPAEWKSLLDQMYMLAGEGARRITDIEAYVTNELGYAPLRLVLSGNAKLVVYAAPAESERDDRVTPHAWVHQITIERGKTKYLEKSRRWAILPKQAASETTLHQWEGADEWASCTSLSFSSFEHKQKVLALAEQFDASLRQLTEPMSESDYSMLFLQWERARECVLADSKTVMEPRLVIPFGIVTYHKTKETRYIGLECNQPQAILHKLAPTDRARDELRASFIRPFANKEAGRKHFSDSLKWEDLWQLCEISTAFADGHHGFFTHVYLGAEPHHISKHTIGPLLGDWFADWQKEIKDYGRAWLADGAADASGRLVLDERMGIRLPEDFEPVRLVSIKFIPSEKVKSVLFGNWMDICPYIPEERHLHAFWQKEDKNPFSTTALTASVRAKGDFGYQSSSATLLSPALARARIEKDAAGAGRRAVPANSLPDAPQPPEGVERWFLVPVA